MTDNHDRRVTGLFVGVNEEAAEERLGAEDGKEIGGSHRQIDPLSLIGEGEIRGSGEDGRELFEDNVLRAPIKKVGGRDLHASAVRGEFLNRHDAICLSIRKRTQQDAVDDAEDGRARADADCERDHHNRGEAGVLQQTANAVADVF